LPDPDLPAETDQTDRAHKTGLARVLSQRDLVLLIIGSVIGSGIFLVPPTVLKEVGGSAPIALSVWIVGGVLSLLGALTYGEMGAMKPQAGGIYVFIRDGFGRLPAFLYGWTLITVINSAGVAALAVAASTNLALLVPIGPWEQKGIAVGMIAVLAAVNVWGTRQSADLQNWTTAIKAGAILVMSAVLITLTPRGVRPAVAAVPHLETSLASAFGVAMIGVLWAYEGWQSVTFSAGETVNPHRTFPRAFVIGTVALIGIYMTANFAYLSALGPNSLAHAKNAASESLQVVVGVWAAKLVLVAILISMFSAANANFLTGPRVYYAMALDGLFFTRLSIVHHRFRTPAFAIVAGAVCSAIFAASGTFDQLLTYVVFAGWIFYALGAAAIFVYRRREPDAVRPFRVPGYPWTPLLYIFSAMALVANTIISKPMDAAVGLSLVAIGIPAYLFWRTRKSALISETVEEIEPDLT